MSDEGRKSSLKAGGRHTEPGANVIGVDAHRTQAVLLEQVKDREAQGFDGGAPLRCCKLCRQQRHICQTSDASQGSTAILNVRS